MRPHKLLTRSGIAFATFICCWGSAEVFAQNSEFTVQDLRFERAAQLDNFIVIGPPNSTITPYVLRLPATGPTSAGQFLTVTNTSSPFQLGWTTAGTATVELVSSANGNLRRIASLNKGSLAGLPGLYANDFQGSRSSSAQTASGDYSLVGGGRNNTASGNYSVVLGGQANTASGQYAIVGGGQGNSATGSYAAILSGHDITNAAQYAVVGGGHGNTITSGGSYSFIGGGLDNTISSTHSVLGGGSTNTVGGAYSVVGGGLSNIVNGSYSVVPGGRSTTVSSDQTFAFNGSVSAITVNTPNSFVVANANIWLANTDNTAREVRFYEPNSLSGDFPQPTVNYVAFRSPTATTGNLNNTYTLPASVGTAGQVLRIASTPTPTTTAATLEWGSAISINVATVNVTNDDQAITAAQMDGVTFLRLDSNGTPVNRTVTLANGVTNGHRLIIRAVATGANGVELADAANLQLNGLATLNDGDTLTLMWDSANTVWVELSRSDN